MSAESDFGEVLLSNCDRKLLKKKILTRGDGRVNPVEGSRCRLRIWDVSLRNSEGERTEDESSAYLCSRFSGETIIGRGIYFLDRDIERCLQNVCLDEICTLRFIYTDSKGAEALLVSMNVHLMDVDDRTIFCDWDPSRKLEHASLHKEYGINLVREDRLVEAFAQFGKALKFLLTLGPEDFEYMTEEEAFKVNQLKLNLYNNLAHCQLHFDEYQAAVGLCDSALLIDPENVKALYRRGSAHMGLENWEQAHADIARVLELDQSVVEAKSKMVILKDKVDLINRAYVKTIKNMFN